MTDHRQLQTRHRRELVALFGEQLAARCGYYCFGAIDLRVRQLVGGECVAEHVF